VLVSLISDGLILVNANPYWVQFFVGALILGGVLLGRVRAVGVRDVFRLKSTAPPVTDRPAEEPVPRRPAEQK